MVDSKWEGLSTDEKLDALQKDIRVLFDAINDATKLRGWILSAPLGERISNARLK